MSLTRRSRFGSRLPAALVLVLLSAPIAGAQGFFPRGDSDCSAALVAADLVLGVRALGGDSPCGNDDCDRDGAVTAADLDCALHCLFGDCPVIPDGPMAIDVTPIATPDIRPLTILRVTGTNLGGPDDIKQATIGGVVAPVVPFEEPVDTLGIVVPLDVSPGPADLIIISGDVPGPPTPITIVPPAPLGELDTYDDTLALMDELTARVLALDLEADFAENTAAVRAAFADIRAAIADQRAAAAADPNLTPEQRAELDAALDASGLADLLRAAIDEVGSESDEPGAPPSGGPAGTRARRAARAAAVLALAGGPLAAAAYIGTAGLIVAAIATATTVVLIFATGPTTLPVILSLTFAVGGLQVDGTAILRVANLDPTRAVLVLKKPSGAVVRRDPGLVAGNRVEFDLPGPEDQTFCGRIDLILEDGQTGRRSRSVPLFVRPNIDDGPDQAFIGTNLRINLRGGLACLQDTLALFENSTTRARTFADVFRSNPVAAVVPDVTLGFYTVQVSHGGFRSQPSATEILGLSGINLSCGATALFVAPQMPSRTRCTAQATPSGVPIPPSGRIVWLSSNPDVGAFDVRVRGPQQDFVAARPGTTMGTATLSCGGSHACERAGSLSSTVTFTVRDEHAPMLTLTSTPAGGDVRAGSAIQVAVSATDNVGLQFLRLSASGDAVENGAQSFTCNAEFSACETSFTVNLKRDGFTSAAVSITATAVDSSDNTTSTDPVAFTVTGAADTTPPVLEVLAPAEGAIIDAGATVQVSIRATDNGPDDTGVKQTLIRVEGQAVASGPDPERLCLPVPMGETTRNASFTIKDAAGLAQVSDRNVLIVLQAVDANGAGCEDGNASAVQFVRVRAGAPPMITSVPAEVNAGEQLTITGQHFGATQGSSVVTVGGMTVGVVSWSDTTIVVAIPSTASGQNLPVIVSVAALDSNTATTSVLGTGDVQITLTWQNSNDLDLHVIDPSGEEIFYGHRTSASGGTLDVDANAGCGASSASPRENVFWAPGTAPTGPYTVRVVYYSGCTEPEVPSPFTVTLRLNSGAPMPLLSATVGPGNTVAEQGFTR